MKETIGPSRIEYHWRSPIETVEYYGRNRYVNHDLDERFRSAEQDESKPDGTHTGWWAFFQEFQKDQWGAGEVLHDLPYRYEGDLQPETNLERIFSTTLPQQIDAGIVVRSYYFHAEKQRRDFRMWTPEPDLEKAVSTYDLVVSFYLSQRALKDLTQR